MSANLTAYEKAGRLLRLLAWIQMILGTLVVAAVTIPHIIDLHLGQTSQGIRGSIFVLAVLWGISIFQLILGKAIRDHREWGRTVGIIYSVCLLFSFPIGTAVGGYVLWCLIRRWNTAVL